MTSTITFKGVVYDDRHGGPFDRGMMDSYYRRQPRPHYYTGNTGLSERIEADRMTEDEKRAYWAGMEYNDEEGDFKDWGYDDE